MNTNISKISKAEQIKNMKKELEFCASKIRVSASKPNMNYHKIRMFSELALEIKIKMSNIKRGIKNN